MRGMDHKQEFLRSTLTLAAIVITVSTFETAQRIAPNKPAKSQIYLVNLDKLSLASYKTPQAIC